MAHPGEANRQSASAAPVWAAEILERRQASILSDFEARLRALESPLLSDSQTGEQLKAQARAILGDIATLLRGGAAPEDELSEVIGSSRADRRIHPGESLRAALELSEAALFAVVEELTSGISRAEVAEVAAAIQRATMERVARASVSYIDRLLREASQAHIEERRRISRELHDRVANSLAVVHRNVELYEVLKEKDSARAEQKLALIRRMTEEALVSVRDLSVELRRSAIRDGIETALSDLLPTMVPSTIRASVSVRGDESLIPPHVKDEIFFILQEALRNAVAHSTAREMRVELLIDPDLVRASVRDDGRGFDPESEGFKPGAGLDSMEERAHLLGGTLRVRSRIGEGTGVEVEVPVGKHRR